MTLASVAVKVEALGAGGASHAWAVVPVGVVVASVRVVLAGVVLAEVGEALVVVLAMSAIAEPAIQVVDALRLILSAYASQAIFRVAVRTRAALVSVAVVVQSGVAAATWVVRTSLGRTAVVRPAVVIV